MHESKQIDDGSLMDRIYGLALERIDELMGCTEDSPEERELSLWAEIADRIEHFDWLPKPISRVRPRRPNPDAVRPQSTEGGGGLFLRARSQAT